MWIPRTPDEVEAAAKAGQLSETPSFDAKAELPAPKKNVALAIDVAAMSTDGGVLLYGVAEDDNGQPTIPHPIPLDGVGQRIDQIVATSISEVPYIEVLELPLNQSPDHGYVAVVVPQSERSPHQVTVGQDFRFYGRGPKGNRILSEGEVARLYRRRQEWSRDRRAILSTVIQHSGVPPEMNEGHLHAFTRPAAEDPELFERAIASFGGTQAVHQRLLAIVSQTQLAGRYGPNVERAHYWEHQSADEWRLANRSAEDRLSGDVSNLVEMRVNLDGRGQLFCGRATDAHIGDNKQLIIEPVIAGNLEAFFAIMGSIYEAAGYHGQVDVGVAITGVKNANSYERSQNFTVPALRYSADSFSRDAGVSAAELRDAAGLTHRLLRHFFATSSGFEDYNPFDDST